MPSDYFILGGKPVLGISPAMLASLPAGSADAAHFDIDWRRVARVAGLSRAEAAIFVRAYRDEQPVSSLSAALGISRREADRTLDSVRQKLQDNAPAVRECFRSIIPDSEQIIANERNYICLIPKQHTDNFVQTHPVLGRIGRRPNVKFSMKRTSLMDLGKALPEERSKLDTVLAKAQAAEQAAWQAEQSLGELRAAETSDGAQAILEGREPDRMFAKRIAAAAAEYATAIKARDAHRMALDQQRAVVSSIESEISARRIEALEADLAGPAKDLRKALELLSDASLACNEVFRTHAARGTEFNLFSTLFPPAIPRDPMDDLTVRQLALNAYLAALQVSQRQGWSIVRKTA